MSEAWDPGSIDVKRTIAIRLNVLARQLRQRFDRHVTSHGVTRSQWSMIVVVARHPGSTQRMIAEALEMSEASAGRLIDRLCAEGLLRRQERDDDRRARAIYVTDKAKLLLDSLSGVAKRHEEVVFEGFAPEELAQLRDYLARIYDNVARDGR
ncbi:MAG TPA: MarR family winged helix-turn-helix transcriptional regulator [Novosphingobium sp.]